MLDHSIKTIGVWLSVAIVEDCAIFPYPHHPPTSQLIKKICCFLLCGIVSLLGLRHLEKCEPNMSLSCIPYGLSLKGKNFWALSFFQLF